MIGPRCRYPTLFYTMLKTTGKNHQKCIRMRRREIRGISLKNGLLGEGSLGFVVFDPVA